MRIKFHISHYLDFHLNLSLIKYRGIKAGYISLLCAVWHRSPGTEEFYRGRSSIFLVFSYQLLCGVMFHFCLFSWHWEWNPRPQAQVSDVYLSYNSRMRFIELISDVVF